MGAERSFDGQPVHYFRAGPAFWRAKHNRGPNRWLELTARPCSALNVMDCFEGGVECRSKLLMNLHRIVPFDEGGDIAVSGEKSRDLSIGRAAEKGGIGNLVSVEMQNR